MSNRDDLDTYTGLLEIFIRLLAEYFPWNLWAVFERCVSLPQELSWR